MNSLFLPINKRLLLQHGNGSCFVRRFKFSLIVDATDPKVPTHCRQNWTKLAKNLCTSRRLFHSSAVYSNLTRGDDAIAEAQIVSERFSSSSSHGGTDNSTTTSSSLQQQEREELERLEQALQDALESHNQDNHSKESLHAVRDAYENLCYWDQALAVEEQIHENEHLTDAERAASLYRIGKLQMRLGKPPVAQKYYQQALDLYESLPLKETTTTRPEQGNLLISMAGIHFHAGDLDAAMKQLQQAEPYFFDEDNEPHPDIIKCLEHEGLVARTDEDFKAALRHYKHALEQLEHINFTRSLWQEEPMENVQDRRLGLMMDMADMHAALGEFESALKIYQDVQKRDQQRRQNPDGSGYNQQNKDDKSILQAILLHNMGKIYAQQDKLTLALSMLRQAAKSKQRLLGDTHPETGKTLSALGAVCAKAEQPREALEAFQQALLIARMHADGENDPEVLLALRNIAVLKGEKVAKWGDDKHEEPN